jgi:hypothetical protein
MAIVVVGVRVGRAIINPMPRVAVHSVAKLIAVRFAVTESM